MTTLINSRWKIFEFARSIGRTLGKIRLLSNGNPSIKQDLSACTTYTIERAKNETWTERIENFWIWTVHQIRSFFFEQNSSIHNHDERPLTPFFSWIARHSRIGHIPFTYPTGSRLFPRPEFHGFVERHPRKFRRQVFIVLYYAPPIFNFNSSWPRASSCNIFLTLIDRSKSLITISRSYGTRFVNLVSLYEIAHLKHWGFIYLFLYRMREDIYMHICM